MSRCECGRGIGSTNSEIKCKCGRVSSVIKSANLADAKLYEPEFVQDRRGVCNGCEENVGGFCQAMIRIGIKPARIECSRGIHRAKSKCIIGKWDSVDEILPHPIDRIRSDGFNRIDQVRLVSVHFNPLRNKRQRETYFEWVPTLGPLAKSLIVYELVFDEDEPEIEGSVVIRGSRARNWMWQKEAILNRALSDCPQRVKYFGWLDHDIVIAKTDWLSDAVRQIDDGMSAVQLFRAVTYLSPNRRQLRTIPGRAAIGTGNPGGLWLADRSFLDSIGGFHYSNVVGGGDQWSFSAMSTNCKHPMKRRLEYVAPKLRSRIHQYIDKAKRHGGRVGFVDSQSWHIYHGDFKNRQYRSRDGILKRADFDPDRDIRINADGILEWCSPKPQLHQEVREYFENRKEDE